MRRDCDLGPHIGYDHLVSGNIGPQGLTWDLAPTSGHLVSFNVGLIYSHHNGMGAGAGIETGGIKRGRDRQESGGDRTGRGGGGWRKGIGRDQEGIGRGDREEKEGEG